jgi:hypothetical protein
MPNYVMQARSSSDGLLKSWNALTPDFAAVGFPGPGTAQHVAIAKWSQDDLLLTTGSGATTGDKPEWNGSTWVKKRNWITINPSDSTDRQAEVQAALNSRVGVCVELVDGPYRFDSGITVQPGAAFIGRSRGMAIGHRHFAPQDNTGSLLKVYGTGKFITAKYDSHVGDIEIYYPNQVTSGTSPVVHDWTLYVAANEHGTTFENITAINPYKFLYCSAGGMHAEKMIGFPLNIGVHLARCPDVIRLRDFHLHPANNSSMAQSLIDHVHATGRAVLIDGAEGYDITGLFAHSYNVGYQFVDEDGDGEACYGRVSGGGIEGVNICVHVPQPTTLVAIGGKFHQVGLVPEIGASHHAVLCADNFTPSDHRRNPRLHFTDCSIHSGGGGTDRAVWVQSNSHAQVSFTDSVFHTFLNEGARNDSTVGGTITLDNVTMPRASIRTGGTGIVFDDRGKDGDGTMASHNGRSFNATVLTDATATITWTNDGGRALPDGALTANRVLDIDNSTELTGQAYTIYIGRQGFTYELRDHSNASLITAAVGTRWRVDLVKATNWAIDRAVRLA